MEPISGRCTDDVVARVGVELAMRASGERTSESMARSRRTHKGRCGHKCSPGDAGVPKRKEGAEFQQMGFGYGKKQAAIRHEHLRNGCWSKKKSRRTCFCSPTGLSCC